MRPYSGFTLLSGIYSPPIQGLCAKGKKCISKNSEIQTWEFTKLGHNMLYIYYIYAKLQWSWLKIEDEMFRTNEGLIPLFTKSPCLSDSFSCELVSRRICVKFLSNKWGVLTKYFVLILRGILRQWTSRWALLFSLQENVYLKPLPSTYKL